MPPSLQPPVPDTGMTIDKTALSSPSPPPPPPSDNHPKTASTDSKMVEGKLGITDPKMVAIPLPDTKTVDLTQGKLGITDPKMVAIPLPDSKTVAIPPVVQANGGLPTSFSALVELLVKKSAIYGGLSPGLVAGEIERLARDQADTLMGRDLASTRLTCVWDSVGVVLAQLQMHFTTRHVDGLLAVEKALCDNYFLKGITPAQIHELVKELCRIAPQYFSIQTSPQGTVLFAVRQDCFAEPVRKLVSAHLEAVAIAKAKRAQAWLDQNKVPL
ncbi:hypothetical protein PAPYR_8871 [Paratrimastix pyriformis]|uniref:Uncharacterized protein n=1 Tax=Paratrimastix pyriformis TaxID=342808 RepID=A0ABQ8UGT7_9EUKA|nr:hypothetical protein PAPYR_8871 [Paratrimastix pyriformis]